MRKPLTLLILFLFCFQAVSQVKFVLKAGENNAYCDRGVLNFSITLQNETDKTLWIHRDVLNPPTPVFYMMMKRDNEKDYTKVAHEYTVILNQRSFFKLLPSEKENIVYSFPSFLFPEKYKSYNFLFKIFSFLFDNFLITTTTRDCAPLKPGKYEIYFVYNLNVNPRDYHLNKNALLGTYKTNPITINIPPCSSGQKIVFFVNHLKENKEEVFMAFFFYGLIIFVFALFALILWLFCLVVRKFLFKKLVCRKLRLAVFWLAGIGLILMLFGYAGDKLSEEGVKPKKNKFAHCNLEKIQPFWYESIKEGRDVSGIESFVLNKKDPMTAFVLLSFFEARQKLCFKDYKNSAYIPYDFFFTKAMVLDLLCLVNFERENARILYEKSGEPEYEDLAEKLSDSAVYLKYLNGIKHNNKEVLNRLKTKLLILQLKEGKKINITEDMLSTRISNLTVADILLLNGIESPVLKNLDFCLNHQSGHPLILSAGIGNCREVFGKLIEKEWNKTDRNGLTWLDYAIIFSRKDLIDLYKDNAMKLKSVRDKFGNTPIFYAIQCGQTEIAKMLLENGVSPKEKNCYNHTVMEEAMIYGNIDLMRYLIAKGEKITQESLDRTIRYQYPLLNFPQLVKFYRERGLKVDDVWIKKAGRFKRCGKNEN